MRRLCCRLFMLSFYYYAPPDIHYPPASPAVCRYDAHTMIPPMPIRHDATMIHIDAPPRRWYGAHGTRIPRPIRQRWSILRLLILRPANTPFAEPRACTAERRLPPAILVTRQRRRRRRNMPPYAMAPPDIYAATRRLFYWSINTPRELRLFSLLFSLLLRHAGHYYSRHAGSRHACLIRQYSYAFTRTFDEMSARHAPQ